MIFKVISNMHGQFWYRKETEAELSSTFYGDLKYVHISDTQFVIIDHRRDEYTPRYNRLGILHNTLGPAFIRWTVNNPDFSLYAYHGVIYKNQDDWFQVLSIEEKREFLWTINDNLQ